MKPISVEQQLNIDRSHIWHPYSAMNSDLPTYHVNSAEGVYLQLSDGRRLIDGMASWWCAIHGYNHPVLNEAIQQQLGKMSHVMFGGLTHEPAIELTRRLVEITPAGLDCVFISDSGSVSVEVAMKMAIQYWQGRGLANKQHFVTIRHGYHGDTLGAMSVCDPVTGMHSLFQSVLAQQYFIDAPTVAFESTCQDEDLQALGKLLENHQDSIAALILEPIVQGAGGMRFYSADYLARAKSLCEQYQVLLIADEIATGFARTGELFACEHAAITPDIMCLGKALTGGYLSMAATLATREVSETIDRGNPGVFMHGPTFMGNPLAAAVAVASIDLLLSSPWRQTIHRIADGLQKGLAACQHLDSVKEVRVLGAIGVVEMEQPVDMKTITGQFIEAGVWVRPFGRLVYLMPPFVISDVQLEQLTGAVVSVVSAQTA